jgi:hypothetical protein
MYQRQWLRQSKIQEYYLTTENFTCQNDMDYQLYWAVVDGKVRSRHEGEILKDEQLYKLRTTKWSKTERYALPFDLEISVEDVKNLWPWDKKVQVNASNLSADLAIYAGAVTWVDSSYGYVDKLGEAQIPEFTLRELTEQDLPKYLKAFTSMKVYELTMIALGYRLQGLTPKNASPNIELDNILHSEDHEIGQLYRRVKDAIYNRGLQVINNKAAPFGKIEIRLFFSWLLTQEEELREADIYIPQIVMSYIKDSILSTKPKNNESFTKEEKLKTTDTKQKDLETFLLIETRATRTPQREFVKIAACQYHTRGTVDFNLIWDEFKMLDIIITKNENYGRNLTFNDKTTCNKNNLQKNIFYEVKSAIAKYATC